MQISRLRLPSLLKKGKQKSQLNSNSWGADKRRNKMVTRRRTVLTGWTRITSKYLSRLPLRRRLANFCESLCKANEVFRGVSDSDPGCPNKPEDLCYMDDFFLWTVSRWKYILLNCRWNFNFEKGKKEKNVFSFAGIEFNITTSNAELLLLLFFFVEGDEFLSLHYSNWERFWNSSSLIRVFGSLAFPCPSILNWSQMTLFQEDVLSGNMFLRLLSTSI